MLGVLVTLVVTHILRNRGKVLVFSGRTRIRYFKNVDDNVLSYVGKRQVPTAKLNETIRVRLDIELEFFNSSDVLRGYRNVKLGFYHESTHFLFERILTTDGLNENRIKFLNLPPKTMYLQKVVCNIDGDNLIKYKNLCDSLKVICEDHKGKILYLDIDIKLNK
ncbi:hypothetical protein [Alkalicoccobacillus gibsonii]|uniref:hypothetical protein n=1 Tax=Alkalicoccobacillus gibsonii TaxID=79881 RepID=UPI0019334415|nr:hypothetical protein [Alkalicoccobacillus gibsonii]MBM0064948.1 hypothetical protein [Alkalicoccobacillus gibsonii]